MREIKFRAWDRCGKTKMLQVSQLSWEIHNDNIERLYFHGKLDMKDPGSVISGFGAVNVTEDVSSWVLMQYTGLKDKNGKEIYEGDIVKIWGYGFKDNDENNEDGLFQDMGNDTVTMERFPCYWLENEHFGYEGEDLISSEECEIIGNIYENSGLLKG